MKRLPAVVSVVFTILAISVLEVSSENNVICKKNDRLCYDDTDCCSGNCGRFFTLKKYCKTSIIDMVKNFATPKMDDAMCLSLNITSPFYKEEFSEPFSAAHETLPINTIVEVMNNNKKVLVQINERVTNKTQGLMLYLSQKAAKEVDIPVNTTTHCTFRIPAMQNWFILKNLYVIIPISGVILTWIILKHFIVRVVIEFIV